MKLIIFLYFLLLPNFAIAYIGPGMAGGVVTASFAVIAAIFICLFGVIWFPIKRWLKKKKSNQTTTKSQSKSDYN